MAAYPHTEPGIDLKLLTRHSSSCHMPPRSPFWSRLFSQEHSPQHTNTASNAMHLARRLGRKEHRCEGVR